MYEKTTKKSLLAGQFVFINLYMNSWNLYKLKNFYKLYMYVLKIVIIINIVHLNLWSFCIPIALEPWVLRWNPRHQWRLGVATRTKLLLPCCCCCCNAQFFFFFFIVIIIPKAKRDFPKLGLDKHVSRTFTNREVIITPTSTTTSLVDITRIMTQLELRFLKQLQTFSFSQLLYPPIAKWIRCLVCDMDLPVLFQHLLSVLKKTSH